MRSISTSGEIISGAQFLQISNLLDIVHTLAFSAVIYIHLRCPATTQLEEADKANSWQPATPSSLHLPWFGLSQTPSQNKDDIYLTNSF